MRQFCAQNFSSIGCNCEELSCKRPDGRTDGPVATRIAAALVLNGFGKIEGTPQALIKAYQNTDRRLVSRPIRIRIIQTLGELGADPAAGLINSAILDRDPWIARAAAKSAGRIRGISSIDPLIRRLQFIESKEGEKPVSGGGAPDPGKGSRAPGDPTSDGGIDSQRKTERQVLQSQLHEALHAITRQRQSCADAWSKWWTQNRKDFRVPP